MTNEQYKCPKCGGEYPEPIEVMNSDGIDHHECPHCGENMSTRFTQEKNVENCVHTTTVDEIVNETGWATGEACTSCGLTWDSQRNRVRIQDHWNAAGGRQ